jgi:GDP-4-dehydro-6-deoxy-D-mannose reductase
MKNILITGANGFVGQHLAKELSNNGYSVHGIGGEMGSSDPVDYFSTYKTVDLRSAQETAAIDLSAIDGVVHLAGLAAVGPSFGDPMLYIETNVGIEVNLFEAALAQNAKPRFLIISSGALYDPSAPLPLNEDSPVSPSSPYAVSKLGQEQMAQYYAGRGFECVIGRPFNHIGPGQGPGFIVADLAQELMTAEREQKASILIGNLDSERDFTDVRDIVQAYRLLLEKGRAGELYNICSGTPVSGHQILSGLLEASKSSITTEPDPSKMRPADNPIIYGSHEKLSHDTGWQPTIPLQTTLIDVIADWRSKTT